MNPISTVRIGNTLFVIANATLAYDLNKLRRDCVAQAERNRK